MPPSGSRRLQITNTIEFTLLGLRPGSAGLKRDTRKTLNSPRRLLLIVSLGISLSVASAAQSDTDSDYQADTEAYARLNLEASNTVRLARRSDSTSEKHRHLDRLRFLADQGSSVAAFELGYAHLLGLSGLGRDVDQAVVLIEQAAREEEPFILFAYGMLLLSGEHVVRDTDRGNALIRRAAELGNLSARVVLMERLAGTGAALSDEQRSAWYDSIRYEFGDDLSIQPHGDEILNRAFANANAFLAHLYRTGVFVSQDLELADVLTKRIPDEQRENALTGLAFVISQTHRIWHDQRVARLYYESVIDNAPPHVVNNYAWLLATAVESSVRDGDRAVQIMEELLAAETENAPWVDTLAAAYAEAGRFELAVETQSRVIEMFENNSSAAEAAVARRNLYIEGKTWRD